MARYEGMDEILQRLSLRFGQEALPPAPTPASEPAPLLPPASPVTAEPLHVRAAIESLARLRQEAERLRELLTEAARQQFSPDEQDELLALLGKVMHDLWSCETALQRVAPLD